MRLPTGPLRNVSSVGFGSLSISILPVSRSVGSVSIGAEGELGLSLNREPVAFDLFVVVNGFGFIFIPPG